MDIRSIHSVKTTIMSNAIIATLKNGKQIKIGHNVGGYKPVFYIRPEWKIPSFIAMRGFLDKNAVSIYLGCYSSTINNPGGYTHLTPFQFSEYIKNYMSNLKSQIETSDQFYPKYKQDRFRFYGHHKYHFHDGVYTDACGIDFWWYPASLYETID